MRKNSLIINNCKQTGIFSKKHCNNLIITNINTFNEERLINHLFR